MLLNIGAFILVRPEELKTMDVITGLLSEFYHRTSEWNHMFLTWSQTWIICLSVCVEAESLADDESRKHSHSEMILHVFTGWNVHLVRDLRRDNTWTMKTLSETDWDEERGHVKTLCLSSSSSVFYFMFLTSRFVFLSSVEQPDL